MAHEIVFNGSYFKNRIKKKLCIYDRPITEKDALQIKELDDSYIDFDEDPEIFRFFPNLITLTLSANIKILPAFKYMPKLQTIYIEIWDGDEVDLGYFSHLKHLQSLHISGGDVSDIDMVNPDALIVLPQLRSLYFHEFGTIDLKFFEKMPALEDFACNFANEIKNSDSIRSVKSLKSLQLIDFTLHDVDFLDAFPDSLKLGLSGIVKNDVDIEKLLRFTEHDIRGLIVNGKYIPDSYTTDGLNYFGD